MINLLLILLCGIRFVGVDVTNNRPVVLCWGDSNTVRGHPDGESYPDYLVDLGMRINVINKGVSGDTIVDMMDRFSTDVEPNVTTGDFVILLGGLNDDIQGADADSIYGLVQSACSLAATTGATVLVSTYPITAGDMYEVSDSIRVYHLNFADGLIDPSADVYIGEGANHSDTTWFANVLHWSSAGYSRYTELYVSPVLEALI